jgi:predicted GNAT superfamily acetyltransferase
MIEWTFDPLVRRNAYFNLVKLGARVVGYEPAFYGEMHDVFNDGDETDRAVIRWNLETPDTPTEAIDGAVILAADDAGRPVASPANGPESGALRAWVPPDIVEIRRRDAALARAWRQALRDTFGAAVRDGYLATAMSRDGWYTLIRGEQ